MGRGSSGIKTGGRQNNARAGNKAAAPASGWRADYEEALRKEKQYMDQAKAMEGELKAAKDAYYKAPTRSKAQKAEAERLEKIYNELSKKDMMLRYRAAQLATFADNLLYENAFNEWRRKNKKR